MLLYCIGDIYDYLEDKEKMCIMWHPCVPHRFVVSGILASATNLKS